MELLMEFDEPAYRGADAYGARDDGVGSSNDGTSDTVEAMREALSSAREDAEAIVTRALEEALDDEDTFRAMRAYVSSDVDEDALAMVVIKLLELVGGEATEAGIEGEEEDEGRRGGEEENEEKRGMDATMARCDARYVKLAVELATVMQETKFGPSHRGALLRGVRHVLRSYMGNCHEGCDLGVVRALIEAMDALLRSNENGRADNDVKLVAECVRHAAGFSTSPLDFKLWLEIASTSAPDAKSFILDQLNMTLQTRFSKGPREVFLLDGESSGILGSAQAKWPFTEGLALVTWMYLESISASESTAASAASYAAAASASQLPEASPFTAAAVAAAAAGKAEVHMPRLFSFLSAEGQGVCLLYTSPSPRDS